MVFHLSSVILAISAQSQATFANELSITPKNDTMVGWTNDGATRGTWDIISSCSFVIILCTWNVLHCNIPAPSENSLKRVLRLVKYTLVNILAPEAMFMVAMIELQTARRDSGLLKEWYERNSEENEKKIDSKGKEEKVASVEEIYPVGSEEPDFKKIAQLVAAHWLITLRWLMLLKPPESPQPEEMFPHINKSRRRILDSSETGSPGTISPKKIPPHERFLTVTHAYYANMGGVRVKVGYNPATYFCITAQQLATVKFDDNFSPLKHLTITEDDINDKSKLDRMTQLLTISQIFWLILSVLERKISGLNCTQLEILAFAFAVQAMATYIAFSKKPNNIGQPTTISLRTFSENPRYDEAIRIKLKNTNLLSLCKPWISHSDTPKPGTPSTVRVLTDSFDLTAVTNSYTVIYLVMAILYNGIHLLAWGFTFPTAIERKMWRVASMTALAGVLSIGLESVLLLWGHKSQVLKSPHEKKGIDGLVNWLVRIVIIIEIPAYVASRLILIGIAFSSLRRLPENVYVTTWSRYIPYLC